MRLSFVRNLNSIAEAVTTAPLADFIVLTGPNGAGKSNLLQAIAEGAITIEGVPATFQSGQSTIRQFRLSELVTQAESPQSPASYRERYVQFSQIVQSLADQNRQVHMGSLTGDALEDAVRAAVVTQQHIGAAALDQFVTSSGKRLIDLAIADYRRYAPLLIGVRDPFALSVAEVFLSYHQRRNGNDRDQWLADSKGRTDVAPLTDDEFHLIYGAPPWELLNDALRVTGLNYEFVPPQGTEDELPYEPLLVYLPDNTRVRVDQLSSGERTLLAVALSLYTGTSLGTVTQLPLVLLLDEVDASLHPSMVESLLRVVEEVFVRQHGVKVIMTTHSPSTVALAPENALYVMRRSPAPRLTKATRDQALTSLTVGLPTLSVRVENRRQVFVESEYDQACYQKLFELLRPVLTSPYSLSFLAASKGRGGNSNAVIAIVAELTAAGNDLVWGLVDRDDRKSAPAFITYNSSRYAMENLFLDPLGLAVFLIRNHQLDSGEFGLPGRLRHFDLREAHCQQLVDGVVERVNAAGDDLAPVLVHYAGGFTASVPRYWLDIQGHALEERVTAEFQTLRGEGKALALHVIADAYRDMPDFIPSDAVNLLEQLLD